MVYLYKLFSNKKEQTTDAQLSKHNTKKSTGHSRKSKSTGTKITSAVITRGWEEGKGCLPR